MAAFLKLSVFLAVAGFAAAGHLGYAGHGNGLAHGHGHGGDYYAEPNYKYEYGVADKHTGDVKSATESRHGGHTKGSYSLVQPDGVTRTVNYHADPHKGFTADVYLNGHLVKHEQAPHIIPAAHGVQAPVVHHAGAYGHGSHGHAAHGHGHAYAHVQHGHSHY